MKEKIKKLIEKAGGGVQVCYDLNLTTQALFQWGERGLPMKYWDYFIKQTGITAEELLGIHREKWR